MNFKRFVMGIAATLLLSSAFAGKFSICLGSFSKYENATDYVNTLLINGFSITIEPSLVNEKLYYRVLLAETFDTMIAASKVRADFAEEFGRNDIWIMNTNLSKKNFPPIVAKAVQKELKTEEEILSIPKNHSEEILSIPKTGIEPSAAAKVDTEIQEVIVRDFENINVAEESNAVELTEEIAFSDISKVPTTISENVQELIKIFPTNGKFTLDKISLFDLDNIRDGGFKIDTETIDCITTPFIFDFSFLQDESIHAASYGEFTDNDFGEKLSVLMLKMKDSSFKELLDCEISNFDTTFEVEFSIGDEKFNCLMVKGRKTSEEYRLFGENEAKTIFISIQAEDLGKDWINRFIVGQNSEEQDIFKNKLIQKSLLALPNNDEKLDRRFLSFDLSPSADSVERETGFENKEHWNANANFDQEDTILRIGFFDID